MEFARKQLEKYGWTDGKGLGKDENGISEPLKAKLKHSLTGVGYDPAAEFTEHWWTTLYDKAASNLEVQNKNGKTKKIRRKSQEEFEITNSTWKLKKKKKKDKKEDEVEYSGLFVRTAVMGQGGNKTTRIRESDSESDEETDSKDAVKLTDEELLDACQGRTAHKGARHGLRALGKLARIEQQEKMLLHQTKYKGYSHHESIKKNKHTDTKIIVEKANIQSDEEENMIVNKKKKKKNGCNNSETENVCNKDRKVISSGRTSVEPKIKKCDTKEVGSDNSVAITENDVLIGRKSAKSKTKIIETCTQIDPEEEMNKNKKKKRKHTVKESAQSKEG